MLTTIFLFALSYKFCISFATPTNEEFYCLIYGYVAIYCAIYQHFSHQVTDRFCKSNVLRMWLIQDTTAMRSPILYIKVIFIALIEQSLLLQPMVLRGSAVSTIYSIGNKECSETIWELHFPLISYLPFRFYHYSLSSDSPTFKWRFGGEQMPSV